MPPQVQCEQHHLRSSHSCVCAGLWHSVPRVAKAADPVAITSCSICIGDQHAKHTSPAAVCSLPSNALPAQRPASHAAEQPVVWPNVHKQLLQHQNSYPVLQHPCAVKGTMWTPPKPGTSSQLCNAWRSSEPSCSSSSSRHRHRHRWCLRWPAADVACMQCMCVCLCGCTLTKNAGRVEGCPGVLSPCARTCGQ